MEILICSHVFTVATPKKEFDDTFSEFSQRTVQNSPVITLYGKLSDGKKIALHVHKVLNT